MRGGGTVNADGFGAGWYAPAAAAGEQRRARHRTATRVTPPAALFGAAPARYRSDRPLWADTGFAALAAVTVRHRGARRGALGNTGHAGHLHRGGAVRRGPLAVQPQRRGPGLARGGGGGRLRGCRSADLLTLDAPTDSALLWALVRHRLRARDDPGGRLVAVVRSVDCAAPGSRLNLLLTDGTAIWATTWTHALSVRRGAGAVTLASEPLDASTGWAAVPDRSLVVATPQRCDVRPLDADAPAAGAPAA
jgi:glutamine amidotransferase